MKIRRACDKDISGIDNLLQQVLMVHHNGRPDLFKADTKKYTDSELKEILKDDTRPVFVACDEENNVLGYGFCVITENIGDNILTDIKTLYIDDLCVDEKLRGKHIGREIYEYILSYAKDIGCYNVTLNVWECNGAARKFYESLGLIPYKTCMEKIL